MVPPGMVMAQPSPISINAIQAGSPDGATYVVLRIATHVGVFTYFVESEVAKKLGGELVRLGGAGRVMLANQLPGGNGGA